MFTHVVIAVNLKNLTSIQEFFPQKLDIFE